MPRHFNEAEREAIERKLVKSAKELFAQYGVSKTTISDITDRAKIGKGTFYLFFKSKGDIFLSSYVEEWSLVHEVIDSKYKNRKGNLPDLILEYIYENRNILLNHPILSIVYNRDTLALISNHSVTEQLDKFRKLGDDRLIDIIESWIQTNHIICNTDVAVISGMMRSLSYLNYHKDEIGEEKFEEVIRKLADGILLVVSQERW